MNSVRRRPPDTPDATPSARRPGLPGRGFLFCPAIKMIRGWKWYVGYSEVFKVAHYWAGMHFASRPPPVSATERKRLRDIVHTCGWPGAPDACPLWIGRHR